MGLKCDCLWIRCKVRLTQRFGHNQLDSLSSVHLPPLLRPHFSSASSLKHLEAILARIHTLNSTRIGAITRSFFHPKDATLNITIINPLSKYIYIFLYLIKELCSYRIKFSIIHKKECIHARLTTNSEIHLSHIQLKKKILLTKCHVDMINIIFLLVASKELEK